VFRGFALGNGTTEDTENTEKSGGKPAFRTVMLIFDRSCSSCSVVKRYFDTEQDEKEGSNLNHGRHRKHGKERGKPALPNCELLG